MSETKKNTLGGFTLIEVMVVIAIIGILAGMAVAGMGEVTSRELVKGQVKTVEAFIEETSARAHALNQNLYMKADVTNSKLNVYTTATATGTIIASMTLDEKAKFVVGTPASVPTGISGTLVDWAATATILAFTPASRIGLNALATDGYIRIQSRRIDRIEGYVAKTATLNKSKSFLSFNSGTNWRAL